MTTLLVIIYLAFISLGLPDSILGAAWPALRLEIGASLSAAGLVSMIVSGGTILSSLASARVIRKLGTGPVAAISTAMTAFALLGYSVAPAFWWLCLMAIPLGLGAGSIDAALNNFVALHYEAKQMSWLHCFWGLGATAGPILLSLFLGQPHGWKPGIRSIALIQLALVAALALSLPLWKRAGREAAEEQRAEEAAPLSNRQALRLRGLKPALLTFFCYCGAELGCGLWASSYLVGAKGVAAATAAGWVSLYYAGITLGRFLSGFAMNRFSCRALIRAGGIVAAIGSVLFLLPLPPVVSMAALIIIGLGCAPVYPCMIHETPTRFGKANSQVAMGLQMATAYVGSTFMPPLFGLIADHISVALFPFFLLALFLIMIFAGERTAKQTEA